MAFDNTKYDIELNDQGFRVSAISRRSQPDFVARFNTGDVGETDATILKTKSILDFQGGMFQDHWQDDSKVDTITNFRYDPLDKKLYANGQANKVAEGSGYNATNKPTSSYGVRPVKFEDNIWWPMSAGGFDPYLIEFDGSTVTEHAGNSDMTTNHDIVKSIAVHKGEIWVATDLRIASYDGSSWTSRSGIVDVITAYEGRLYGMNSSNKFYVYDDSGASWTELDRFGTTTVSDLIEFGHRLWLVMEDGLWLWDGVRGVHILKYEETPTGLTELNGWLYFGIGRKLYRFNGVQVEYLQDLGGTIGQMTTNDNRLYIHVYYSGSGTYYATGKYGYLSTTQAIVSFDGVGFFIENDKFTDTQEGRINEMFTLSDEIYAVCNGSYGASGYPFKIWEHDTGSATQTIKWSIVTSWFDEGLPQVDKWCESFKLEMEQLGSGYSWDYYYRKDGDTTWTLIDSINYAKDQIVYVRDTFKKIQFKAEIEDTAISTMNVKSISFDYAVMPKKKYNWEVSLQILGNDKYNPLELKDGTTETAKNIELRDAVYDAVASSSPVGFIAHEWDELSQNMTTDLDACIPNFDKWPEEGYIKCEEEIIHYRKKSDGTTDTDTIETGVLGTTATSHSSGTKVYLYRLVVVTQIIRENFYYNDNTRNDESSSPQTEGVESELTVELAEV